MGAPLVLARGVAREYAGVSVLEAFDLEVPAGEAVALIGHNGSGKTTALSIMAGRLEPTRGTVEIDGRSAHARQHVAEVRARVSYVPDMPTLYPDLTVSDHLDLVAMAHGADDIDARRDWLLTELELAGREHALPRELSRGMRQKAQLACAFVRPFSVLILDEPLGGLDPPSRDALHAILVDAKERGASIVFSTHQPDFARGLADRALVLRDGRVVASGSLARVLDDATRGERSE